MLLEDILIQAGVGLKTGLWSRNPDDIVMECPFCTGSHDMSGQRRVFGVDLVSGKAHCHRCIAETELVWTSRGIIPISDVMVDDLVPDLSGTLRRVSDVVKQRRRVMGIALKGFKEYLELTPDHVCVIVTNCEAKRTLPYIWNSASHGTRFAAYAKGKMRRRGYPNIDEVKASDVQKGDFFLFPVLPQQDRNSDALQALDVIRDYTRGPRTSRITALPVNKKTVRLYGLWLAEGSSQRTYCTMVFSCG